MKPRRVKYSRASFLFPEFQPSPHSSWDEEVAILQRHFHGLKGGPSAFQLGNRLQGLQWHVYVADAEGVAPASREPSYCLEVVMTQLARSAARNFYRTDEFVSASHTTKSSGIRDLFPTAEIDDYVFEPCGYSMNGLDGRGFNTIHITPEPDCSYASCEMSCYPPEEVNVSDMVHRISRVFKPGRMTVTVSTDVPGANAWAKPVQTPKGFVYLGASVQELPQGGRVVFYDFMAESLAEDEQPPSPTTVLGGAQGPEVDFEELCASPSKTGSGLSSPTMSDSPLNTPNLSRLQASGFRFAPKPLVKLCGGNHELLEALERHRAVPLVSGSEAALEDYASKVIEANGIEDNLYIFDLANVVRAYNAWARAFPRVRPYYAVKCSPIPAYISVLKALGAGFDCASRTEIDLCVSLGADPKEDIIYANPCKRYDEIAHSGRVGVRLTTFDSVSELHKVKQLSPECGVVLRIKADDPHARCPLGNKYGAYLPDVPELLATAKELGLDLCGVSFHVGSGAQNPDAFANAIGIARQVFDMAIAEGFAMTLLDIGGGFCTGLSADGAELVVGAGFASAVNEALDRHFPAASGVRIISEPGRFFAEYAGTMVTQVYGKRPRKDGSMHYWITDGLYGSMNCVLYDHASLYARPLFSPLLPPVGAEQRGRMAPSIVFGPTCDGLDTVLRNVNLPELRIGDWMAFSRMGAYTIAGATDFNGIVVTKPHVSPPLSPSFVRS